MNKNPFKKGEPAYEALYEWWKETINDDPALKKHRKNKGERAELCRCATPTAVLLCPAFYIIAEPLEEQGIDHERLAAVIGLLAHVRHENHLLLPAAMAEGDNKPKVSPTRFRRLLEAQTVDELYPILRRVLDLLGKTAHLSDLAGSVYAWNDATRKRWAYEYFANPSKKSPKS